LGREDSGREYVTALTGIDNVLVMYFRPEEIPARIDQSNVDLGITGEDLYREFGEGSALSHLLLPKLGFGAARLTVAVPQSWIDVTSLSDIDEVAMSYRLKRGQNLRVATKFPKLTRTFFSANGISNYRIVESSGATEGAPAAGIADMIVDLTSSGATLAQNHLKEITGGTVLETDACLIAARRESLWTPAKFRILDHFVEQIEARQYANLLSLLRFSVEESKAERTRHHLVGTLGCSIVSHQARQTDRTDSAGAPSHDIVATCPTDKVYAAVAFLRSMDSIRIVATRCEFLYDRPSPACEAFYQILKRGCYDDGSPNERH
jgi:ATP phosphoribosyltransferase